MRVVVLFAHCGAVVEGAETVSIMVMTVWVTLLGPCVADDDDDGEITVPERVADLELDQGSVLVMVLSITVALAPEEETEEAEEAADVMGNEETVTVIMCVVVVVDVAAAVEDGDTRVLLVQMGPPLDDDADRVPTPDESDVVDHGRAEPVVRISVVPFCTTVVIVALPAGADVTELLAPLLDPPDPVVNHEV